MHEEESNMNECENAGPTQNACQNTHTLSLNTFVKCSQVPMHAHTQTWRLCSMWWVRFNSRVREAVFTPSELVPGEQRGEKVPNVHSLSNGFLKLYSFPLSVCVCVSVSVSPCLTLCKIEFSAGEYFTHPL